MMPGEGGGLPPGWSGCLEYPGPSHLVASDVLVVQGWLAAPEGRIARVTAGLGDAAPAALAVDVGLRRGTEGVVHRFRGLARLGGAGERPVLSVQVELEDGWRFLAFRWPIMVLEPARRARADMRGLSQSRWKADEGDAGLTWGSLMNGDSFLDAVLARRPFSGSEAVLEIGPGYGRLFSSLRERGVPFARYLGLELSAARAERLSRRFGSREVEFAQADILAGPVEAAADVVLCSATFEHLFPSMAPALENLRAMTRPGASLFIDFIGLDDELDAAGGDAYFEPCGAFVRRYCRREIREFIEAAGFQFLGLERIVLGKDDQGLDVSRLLAAARKPGL